MKRQSLNSHHHIEALTMAAIGIIISIALTSCESYLTDDPKSQITHEEAFNSIEKLKKNALLTVYNYIGGHEEGQGLQGTDRGLYDLNSFTTDEQIIPTRGSDWYDGGLWGRLFFHRWTAGEAPVKNTWDYLYKVVILCNEGIEHIDAFKSTNEKERLTLNAYKAELRAVRAMFYFYLMDLYGRVPIVTKTGIKTNEMTLCERSDLFYWIYNEFNEVLPDLCDECSQLPNSEYYGRMTAPVAYFVMMKMALNAEIYTDDNWTDKVYPDGKDIQLKTYIYNENTTVEANAWETVRVIHDILKLYYVLTNFYSDNFDVGNEMSLENIFVIPMDPQIYLNKYIYFTRSSHYCHGAAVGAGSENGPCATVSTVRAFGYSEKDGANLCDDRFNNNFYYEEVYINSQRVYLDDGKTPLYYYPLAVTEFDLSGEKYEKTAGARIAKYTTDAFARNDARRGNNDIVLFRYADALLMYAEASYRLGDTENALDAMNEVYARSNYTEYDSINEDILLCERLKELMWEGWRRNDLIRFRRFHKPYDLKTQIFCGHEEDAHTIVFPIPADMMVMHPDWKQNPGY